MKDGMLELIDVKKPSILQVPRLALNALQRKFDANALVSSMQGNLFTIEREKDGLVNIDGEPLEMGMRLEFTVKPCALRVVCRN
jgi:diacylglycerol kinase family enzyme